MAKKNNSTLDNGRLKTYSEWSGKKEVVNNTPYVPTGVQQAQDRMTGYKERNQRRNNAYNGLVDLASNYATGAIDAYKSGNYNQNRSAWDKQYNDIMDYIDQYGGDMGGTSTARIKSQLKNIHDQLNAQQTFQPKTQNYVPGTQPYITGQQTATGQQTQNKTVGMLPYSTEYQAYQKLKPSLVPQNQNTLPFGGKFDTMSKINDMARQSDAERRLAYAIGTGQLDLTKLNEDQLNAYKYIFQNDTAHRNYAKQDTQNWSQQFGEREAPEQTVADQVQAAQEMEWKIRQQTGNLTGDLTPEEADMIARASAEAGKREDRQLSPLADENLYKYAVDRITNQQKQNAFFQRYEDLTTADDFRDKSRANEKAYGWTGRVPSNTANDAFSSQVPLTPEEEAKMRYSAINGNRDAINYLWDNIANPDKKSDAKSYPPEVYMTADEVAKYNYLYTQSPSAAEEYFNGLLPYLNQRSFEAYSADVDEMLKDPGAAVLANVAGTFAKPFVGAANFVSQMGDWVSGRQIDPYGGTNWASQALTSIREKTGENIGESLGEWAKFGFNTGMSVVDNLYQMALGAGIAKSIGLTGKAVNTAIEATTLSLMGMDAAQTSVLENLNAGLPQDRAIVMGLASGVVEIVTEKIGLDNLLNSAWKGKGVLKDFIKQSLAEGGEEIASELLNIAVEQIYDYAAGQNLSEIRRQVYAYMAENEMAPEEEGKALAHVAGEKAKEVALAGLSGLVSGAVMGGGFTGLNAIADNLNSRVNASDADMVNTNPEAVRAIVDEGLSYGDGTDINRLAQQMSDRLGEGRNVTNRQMRNLYSMLTQAQPEAEISAREPEAEDYVSRTLPDRGPVLMRNAATNPMEADARSRFVQDIANGYRSAGRTAMATTIQQMYVPGTDASAYVSEMSDVYNSTINGNTKYYTPHLTQQMVDSAVLAAQADRRVNITKSVREDIVNDSLNENTQNVYEEAVQASVEAGSTQKQAQQAFADVYNAAFTGTEIDSKTILPEDARAKVIEQAKADRKEYVQNLVNNGFVQQKEAGVQYTDKDGGIIANITAARAFKESELNQKTLNVMNQFAKDLGIRINLVDSNPKWNGNYQSDKGTIDIALDSIFAKNVSTDTAVLGTVGHEITHRMQDIAPKLYEKLVASVKSSMSSDQFNSLVRKQMKIQPGISYAVAVDEVVADFVGRRFVDDANYADKLLNTISEVSEDTRTVLQKLRDFVRKVIAWIKGNRDKLDNADETLNRFEKVDAALTELYNKAKSEVASGKGRTNSDVDTSSKRLSARDTEYMDAVNSGDMETAQRMVDEAARESGYTVKAYHGTPWGGFNIFNTDRVHAGRTFGKGTYLTSSPTVAEGFTYPNARDYERVKSGETLSQKIYDTYIKVGENALEYDWSSFTYNGRKIKSASSKSSMIQLDIQASPEKDVVIHNIADGSEEKSTVYVIKDANRIKSAGPVVYDDNGNVIPLSQRFNTENPDIRYSVRGEATDFTPLVEIHDQREQIRNAINNTSDWKMNRTELDSKGLRKSTESMLKQYGDKLTTDQKEEIVNDVKGLAYSIIRGNKSLSDVEYEAADIASGILFKASRVNDAEASMAMLTDDSAEQAIDYLTNYILANIVNTQTKGTASALREVQNQIDRNDRLKETLRQVRQRRDENIRRGIEARKAQRLVKTDSNLRKEILKRAKRLNDMKMSKPNQQLREQLIGNMNTDATHITDGAVKKVENLRAWIAEKEASQDENFYVSDSIKKKLDIVNHDYIDDLIKRDDPDAINKLRTLNEALLELEHMVRTQNQILTDLDKKDVRETASAEADNIRHTTGTREGVFRKMDSLIVQGTLSPMRFWHRLTGYNDNSALYRLAQAIDEGGIKKTDFEMRASKKFDKWMSDKKLTKKWVGKKADVITYETVTATGKNATVQLTPGMRMTLYLASQDGDWMRHMCGYDTPDGHISGGGITLPNMEKYKKGGNAYESASTVRITKGFLTKMIADMPAEEKAFADEVKDFFNGMQKEELNTVSQVLSGVDLAKEDDYLPISVDDRFLGTDYGAIKMDGTITGAGAFKDRVDSGKPVVIHDLTDILIKSINTASSYIGYAVPVRDINKIMSASLGYFDENGNYQAHEETLRLAISQKWGSTALSYIDKALSDIQNPVRVEEDLEKAFKKMRSNYARSVLTLNLSVGLKQGASYPTAAAVVGYRPLAKALADRGKIDIDLIEKYTPLLAYRSKGFVSPELGSIKDQNDFWNNLPKGLNWITGIDFLTTRKLWRAAEYYIRDNQPNLYKKGNGIYGQTDEYYEAVAKVYNRIIEETQPNYTPWQRPQYLRSHSGIVQTLMMFKTQPMQNFNVLYDAIGNYRAKERAVKISNNKDTQAQLKEAKTGLRHAITSQIGQLVTFAAMTMAWNVFRRKKEKYTDKEGNFSLDVLFKNIGKDIGSGIFGMIPFGSDAWSLLSSLAFGDKYWGFESVTDSVLSDLGDSVKTAWDAISKIIESDEPFNLSAYKSKIKTVATTVSKLLGIPAENIWNLITALYKRGRDIFDDPYTADVYSLAWDVDPDKNKKEFLKIAYRAYKDGYKETYGALLSMFIEEFGFDEDTVSENMRKIYASQYNTEQGDESLYNAYQHLYDLYKSDEKAFEDEYRKMEELGFSENQLKAGIENCMKVEAGVASVADLPERFVTPEAKAEQEAKLKPLHETSLYKSASDADRAVLEDYALKIDKAESSEWIKAKEGIDSGAISMEDYLRFRMALDQADQPTDSGKMGTYTKDEQLAAIKEMGWSDDKAKKLWEYLPNGSSNPFDEEQKTSKKETSANVKTETKPLDIENTFTAQPLAEHEYAKTSSESAIQQYQEEAEKKREEEKAKLIHETVSTPHSSWVGSVGYDEETGTLTMTTKGGRTYTRTGVSKDMYELMKQDPGRTWNAYFR